MITEIVGYGIALVLVPALPFLVFAFVTRGGERKLRVALPGPLLTASLTGSR
jgi:hypothetical protein